MYSYTNTSVTNYFEQAPCEKKKNIYMVHKQIRLINVYTQEAKLSFWNFFF